MKCLQRASIGLFLLATLAFSCSVSAASTHHHTHHKSEHSSNHCKAEGCKACKTIYERYFHDKKGHHRTLTIHKPGKYCLGENICFKASHKYTTAIVIDADNVSLDLCGFRLHQSNQQAGGVGIFVKAGRNFVSVVNGAVDDFTLCGIQYEEANDAITLDSLTLTGNMGNLGAIWLGPVVPASSPSDIGMYVSNVALTNSLMENNSSGFVINGYENILVENCDVTETLGTPAIGSGGFISGITSDPSVYTPEEQEAGYAQNVRVYNSTFNDGVSVYAGLAAFASINIHIKGCSFNDNDMTGGPSSATAGFVSGSLVNALLEDCQANNNIDINPAHVLVSGYHFSGNDATGLGATSGLIMRNCDAIGNTSITATSGFVLSYQNMLLENCRAIMNHCNQSSNGLFPSASGFQIVSSAGAFGSGSASDDAEGSVSDSVFRGCIATENVAENGPAAGFMWLGGAFDLATNVQENVEFIECVATGNNSLADSSVAPGVAAGILVDRGILANINNTRIASDGFFPSLEYTNVGVFDCTLSGNVASSINGQPLSAGLSLLAVDTVIVRNSNSMGNANGFLLSGGTSWFGQNLGFTSNSIVEGNTALSNDGAGFFDAQANTSLRNVFINNVASNNAPNYQLTAASVSINNSL